MSIDHSVTKERPILFSGPMIQAILDGRKSQTRRVYKLPKDYTWSDFEQGLIVWDGNSCQYGIDELICPYGRAGDRLWVRETWSVPSIFDNQKPSDMDSDYVGVVRYKADGYRSGKLRPSIFMPRWASRILLEITGVRVERLNEITEQDAIAEGVQKSVSGMYCGALHSVKCTPKAFFTAVGAYDDLWCSINGAGSWPKNPWVWVVEFKRVQS